MALNGRDKAPEPFIARAQMAGKIPGSSIPPWFTPAVPAGTAFELSTRALLQGGLRPPTREQAAA